MAQAPLKSHQLNAKPARTPRAIELLPEDQRTPDIKLENIQGDTYPTFPKKAETFIFFTIADAEAFKSKLGKFIPLITTAAKVAANLEAISEAKAKQSNTSQRKLIPLEQIQIAFAKESFGALGIPGVINDVHFDQGPQINEALDVLGDRRVQGSNVEDRMLDWEDVWKATRVHGVITIATESESRCKDVADKKVISLFGDSIHVINTVKGQVRAKEEGHEHFGFLDGISEPAINGLADPHPGQLKCDPGIILMGHKGDPMLNPPRPGQPARPVGRPEWAIDGTIMAFRKLKQFVPEFNKFLHDNPVDYGGLTRKEGSALTGARMVGRWKSGAPIDKLPLRDDDLNILDANRINNFDYSVKEPGEAVPGQTRCPFTAHIRKTAPRNGSALGQATKNFLICRAGIPYGPDVTPEELDANETSIDRGLLFVCYNSTLTQGFTFIQESWANKVDFPPPNPFSPGANGLDYGPDPIIGNATNEFTRARIVTGLNPGEFDEAKVLPHDFVVARGGEYFFVPSMNTLGKLAAGEPLQGFPSSTSEAAPSTSGTVAGTIVGGAVGGAGDGGAGGGDGGGGGE